MKESEKKYRILTCYYRPKPGGFCKRLFRAIDALLTRGHTVHYLAVVPFPIDHPNCHFHRFPWPEKLTSGYLFWGLFHLLAPVQLLYLGFTYQINRVFAFGHNYALLLQPLRILRQIPLTVFFRADIIKNHQIQDRSSLLIWLEHVLEGLGIAGTRLYGVSETLTNKTIARHGFFKPSTSGVLRNDIAQHSAVSEKTRMIHAPFRLACVGILEPRKNQRFLLKLMEKIKAYQAQLYLYGIGPDEKLIKEIIKNENLIDRVHCMGWIAAEKIWHEVDLLLMPSLHEGAPNAVLEALGNGVPVLVSDIPEHAEILPKKYLFPLGNPLKWKAIIAEIINNPESKSQELVYEQRNSVQHLMFDWEQEVVEKIL